MDFLKALFDNGAITWEQFVEGVNTNGYKLADLATGNYVAKKKFEDEITSRDATITELNSQISTRDTDIKSLKKSLEDGSKDNETKIFDLTEQLTTLQGDYKKAKSDYETKLSKQAYEFAVKEFSGNQKFSSTAAKRDFEREMLSANLTMQDSKILGADDFVTKYKETNSDAFVVVEEPTPEPQGQLPTFVQPTAPTPQADTNPFEFNFAGVR